MSNQGWGACRKWECPYRSEHKIGSGSDWVLTPCQVLCRVLPPTVSFNPLFNNSIVDVHTLLPTFWRWRIWDSGSLFGFVWLWSSFYHPNLPYCVSPHERSPIQGCRLEAASGAEWPSVGLGFQWDAVWALTGHQGGHIKRRNSASGRDVHSDALAHWCSC